MTQLHGKEIEELIAGLKPFWNFQRHQLVSDLEKELDRAEAKYVELLQSHDLVFQENQATAGELSRLQDDHEQVKGRFELLSALLAATPTDNRGLQQFRRLFQEDFMDFANEESSLANEAEMLLRMQAIERELELVVGFPVVHSKSNVAVAGGFSSGKSEFINSFIQDKSLRLAVGLNPVTAIPAYVTGDSESAVKAFTSNGGSIELHLERYLSISHEFVKSFDFDLKTLMPYVSIGTQLDEEWFRYLCLIDTPGYNPSMTEGHTEKDQQAASEFAGQSNALIWVIGLDSTGTIPASDFYFLHQLELAEDVPFYVVANKADLRSPEDLEAILDEFEEVLEIEGIEYQGISAYSSVGSTEYAFRGQSLGEFFQSMNTANEVKDRLEGQLRYVFSSYREALSSELERYQRVADRLKSVRLDLLEAAEEDLYEKTRENFEALLCEFPTADLKSSLKKVDKLEKAMTGAIELALGEALNGD